MRLGILGGSFDPVHNAHVALARACRDQAGLDEVRFLPAAVPPHKRGGPVASDADRVAMLRLAIAEEPGLTVSTLEIDRGGVSYTVDTLHHIADENPGAELFLLMGADTLNDLPTWREPAEILALAAPLVVHRAGEPPPDFERLAAIVAPERLDAARRSLVEMPVMDVSSSGVRARLGRGESVDHLVPSGVAAWIRDRGLYGGGATCA